MSSATGETIPSWVKHTPILDDYDINWSHTLGTGASGNVRLASKRSQPDKKYAVKVLIDTKRARHEIQLHHKLVNTSNHTGVVKLYDVYLNEIKFPGETVPQSRLLLILEFCAGGELLERLSNLRASQQGLTEKAAAKIIFDIVQILNKLHDENIAHRDLKLENLLYREIDFDYDPYCD